MGVCGDLIIIYPKTYSIYLRGTLLLDTDTLQLAKVHPQGHAKNPSLSRYCCISSSDLEHLVTVQRPAGSSEQTNLSSFFIQSFRLRDTVHGQSCMTVLLSDRVHQ